MPSNHTIPKLRAPALIPLLEICVSFLVEKEIGLPLKGNQTPEWMPCASALLCVHLGLPNTAVPKGAVFLFIILDYFRMYTYVYSRA